MADEDNNHGGASAEDAPVIGSPAIRPIFLGNLIANYSTDAIKALFEEPRQPPNADPPFASLPVERVDLKRGYCFVFLKHVTTQKEKMEAERFVKEINGM